MSNKSFYIDFAIYVFLFIALLVQTSCKSSGDSINYSNKESKSFFAMDTYISVTAYGEDTVKGLKAVENEIKSIENMWSVTDENSEIYKINHSSRQTLI